MDKNLQILSNILVDLYFFFCGGLSLFCEVVDESSQLTVIGQD
jgi:hypothetical protein